MYNGIPNFFVEPVKETERYKERPLKSKDGKLYKSLLTTFLSTFSKVCLELDIT